MHAWKGSLPALGTGTATPESRSSEGYEGRSAASGCASGYSELKLPRRGDRPPPGGGGTAAGVPTAREVGGGIGLPG